MAWFSQTAPLLSSGVSARSSSSPRSPFRGRPGPSATAPLYDVSLDRPWQSAHDSPRHRTAPHQHAPLGRTTSRGCPNLTPTGHQCGALDCMRTKAQVAIKRWEGRLSPVQHPEMVQRRLMPPSVHRTLGRHHTVPKAGKPITKNASSNHSRSRQKVNPVRNLREILGLNIVTDYVSDSPLFGDDDRPPLWLQPGSMRTIEIDELSELTGSDINSPLLPVVDSPKASDIHTLHRQKSQAPQAWDTSAVGAAGADGAQDDAHILSPRRSTAKRRTIEDLIINSNRGEDEPGHEEESSDSEAESQPVTEAQVSPKSKTELKSVTRLSIKALDQRRSVLARSAGAAGANPLLLDRRSSRQSAEGSDEDDVDQLRKKVARVRRSLDDAAKEFDRKRATFELDGMVSERDQPERQTNFLPSFRFSIHA